MPKTPTKSTIIKQFLKKVQPIVAALQKNRDDLRSLLDEYKDILDDADEAARDLEDVVEKLSQRI